MYLLYKFFVKFFKFFAKSLLFLLESLYFLISSANFSVKFFVFLIHSFCTTYFHVFSMTGIHPELIESKIFWTNSINILPVKALLWKDLGVAILYTLSLKLFAWTKNSFRSISSGKFCIFCKSLSFSTGRTIVKQSLSGKYVFIKFLTLFFSFIISESPTLFSKALSKYSFSEILLPSLSSNFKLKSLKSHKKEGKYSDSSSSLSLCDKLLIFIILLKFKMKLKEFIAVSSMAPKELKINKELINIAIKNILLSWLISSS